MQVSNVDAPQQTGSEKSQNQSPTSVSGMFAALLKGATGQDPSLMRLEGGTGLAQNITSNEPQPTTDEEVRATDTEETFSASDPDEPDSVPSNEERPDETVEATGTSQTANPQAAALLAGTENTANSATTSTATEVDSGILAAPAAAQANNKTAAQNPTTQQISTTAAQATPQATAPEQKIASVLASTLVNGQPIEKQNGFNRLSATVTDTTQQVVSRPTNTLAAVATVTAQATKQPNATTQQATNGEAKTESSGNLLLNGSASRAANTTNTAQNSTAQASATNAPTPGAGDVNANTAGQAAPPAAALPASQIAANANRPLPSVARGPELLPLEAGNSVAAPGSTTSAAARVAAPITRPTVPPRVLTEQIAVQVQKAVAQGQDRITIQLKPADLGRVEIKLDVMQDGRVAATIVADRPETLDLLQRDARGLQQALQDAGLKANSGSLSFNLGGGNGSNGQQAGDGNGASGQGQSSDLSDAVAENDTAPEPRRASNSMIDVEV